MKSLILHYMNKYPGGRVHAVEGAIDVFDRSGRHCVALRSQGSGQLVCASAEMGCAHAHDLAPIPKDARLFKWQDGKISKDELHDARREKLGAFVKDGRVQSCHELGLSLFDDKQRLTVEGQQKFFAPRPAPAPVQAPVQTAPVVDPSQPQA